MNLLKLSLGFSLTPPCALPLRSWVVVSTSPQKYFLNLTSSKYCHAVCTIYVSWVGRRKDLIKMVVCSVQVLCHDVHSSGSQMPWAHSSGSQMPWAPSSGIQMQIQPNKRQIHKKSLSYVAQSYAARFYRTLILLITLICLFNNNQNKRQRASDNLHCSSSVHCGRCSTRPRQYSDVC